jgi:hypothetical protein
MQAVDDPFELLIAEDPSFSKSADLATSQNIATSPCAVVAHLDGFGLDDQPLVRDLPGLPYEVVPARTTVRLMSQHIGLAVVVLFDGGERRRPIIVGVIEPHHSNTPKSVKSGAQRVSVETDGERVELTADREIVLKCGEASITLTRAGKVLIRGKYVLTHSAGLNRIRGAAVDIN